MAITQALLLTKKEVYDVKKLLPEENLFLQVFLNDGTNYLEDKAITNHIIGQNVKLNIPIEFTQDVSEIRLDPLNVSCVLQNLKGANCDKKITMNMKLNIIGTMPS